MAKSISCRTGYGSATNCNTYNCIWCNDCHIRMVFRSLGGGDRTKEDYVVRGNVLYCRTCLLCWISFTRSELQFDDSNLCTKRFWVSTICLFVFSMDNLSHTTRAIGESRGIVLVCIYWRIECAGCILFELVNPSYGSHTNTMECDYLGACRSIFCISG